MVCGQSGSVVYVVERDTQDLLILGMLTSVQQKHGTDKTADVYQCTVMWPALAQVQAQNRHQVSDLAMVDCDTAESVKAALPSLQQDSGFASQGIL